MSTVYLLYIQYKLFIYSCQGGIGSFVYMHNKIMYYLGVFVIILQNKALKKHKNKVNCIYTFEAYIQLTVMVLWEIGINSVCCVQLFYS